MRVIAGSARRTQLKTLEGMDTRPTTDRIKETLFNMIAPYLYDSVFLDLFAGSGGIGIEALSRGAMEAVFVEKNPKAMECVKENLKKTHFERKGMTMQMDVMTALYKLLTAMGLVNTKTGLIIVYTGTMAVFALWNMKGYFDTIPTEIEEAAMIDGASPVQIVTKIVLPLAKPTIAVTAMMVLVYVWNEYIFAVNFMTGSDTYTLAAGLYSLQATEMSGSWPVFAAASIVVSIPILIVFFALQKNMTTGLTSGGVKG